MCTYFGLIVCGCIVVSVSELRRISLEATMRSTSIAEFTILVVLLDVIQYSKPITVPAKKK